MVNEITERQTQSDLQKFSPIAEEAIKNSLGVCWVIYPNYGADATSLQMRINIFKKLLIKYSAEEINLAFEEYIKNNIAAPTPAHILQIIEGYRFIAQREEYAAKEKQLKLEQK